MEITVHSNIGKKRTSNQDYADYFKSQAQQLLLVLCDGVGGNLAGDVASRLTTEYIGKAFEKLADHLNPQDMLTWMKSQIQAANRYILEMAHEKAEYEGMGTTLVMASLVEDRFLIAHVGDSRAYAYAQETLTQLTEDHSLVNELVKSGEITKEESYTHPHRNIVTQSIGSRQNLEITTTQCMTQDIEVLLLCSDGLNTMLTHQEIESMFQAEDQLTVLADQLVSAANKAGGTDNITLILARPDKELAQVVEGGDQQ